MSVVYSGKRFKRGTYKREKKLKIQEWAEKNMIFTSEDVSPILGNFKTKYSPHYVELFKLAERNLTRKMFAKWASQSGKSLFIVIIGAHKLDQSPATIIYAIPTKDQATDILTLKINPVLKSIPTLWKKFEDYSNLEKFRTKDAIKRVPGGSYVVKGALTSKDRKSLSAPLVTMDEIGEFEEGAVKEFSERTKAYSRFNPLVLGVSTIVHPEDEICTNHDMCEIKIEWHYICPCCGKNFYPEDERLKIISKEKYIIDNSLKEETYRYSEYLKYAKDNVHIECPNDDCNHKIYEKERTEMILSGGMDWFIVYEDGTSELFRADNMTDEISFGIDMNSLGSYFAQLGDIAQEYIEAVESDKKDILLDMFYRGWLNKFYERENITTDENDLLLLSNSIEEWIIPKDTLRVYIGIDMQKDHFWYVIQAFSYGSNSHMVSEGRLETWDDIETLYTNCWNLEGEDGQDHVVAKMGIDKRGYNQDGVRRTDEAVQFVEYMTNKYGSDKVYLMEGHPDIKTSPNGYQVKDVKDKSDNRKVCDIKMVKFSNLYFKNKMSEDIERSISKAKEESEESIAYTQRLFSINQTTIEANSEETNSKSYIRQMTSETYEFHINPKTGKSNTTQTWDMPKKTDNHEWDCTAITYVFAELEKISLMKKPEKIDMAKAVAKLNF